MTAGLNTIILAALAIMWIVVLAWEFVGNIRDGRRHRDPMGSFRRQLDIMGSMAPRRRMTPANRLMQHRVANRPILGVDMPRSSAEAADRRRFVAVLLAGATFLSGVAWYFTTSLVAGVALAATGGLLVGFAYLSMRRRQLAIEQEEKVAYLPSTHSGRLEPARRRAN